MMRTRAFIRFMVVLVAALGLGIGLGSTAQAASGPQPDAPAPEFSGLTAAGDEISLADYAGKTVVLEWTNHDCPFVRKHYDTGNMQQLQASLTGEDVIWLTIVSSAPGKQGHVSETEAQQLTSSRAAHPTHVVLDEEGVIGRKYDARTTPQMFLIRPDQTIAYMGAIDDKRSARHSDVETAHNYLWEAYQAHKAGEPVRVANTTPYGCSVKYAR